MIDYNVLHQRLVSTFADHAHVHVPTAFAELDQSRIDSFVEGASTALCRSHRTSTRLRISSITISSLPAPPGPGSALRRRLEPGLGSVLRAASALRRDGQHPPTPISSRPEAS